MEALFRRAGRDDEGRMAKQKAPNEGYGFVLVPSNPLRLFLPLGAVLSLI